MRDVQRQRLYAAQGVLAPHKRQFRSLEQMQAYVDKIVASDWWKDRSDVEGVQLFLGRKDSSKATCYPAGRSWRGKVQHTPFITLPPTWAATDRTILHELAHVLTPDDEAHGSEYCEAYIEIVWEYMGGMPARKLRESMREYGVAHVAGEKTKTTNQINSERARLLDKQVSCQKGDCNREDEMEFLRLMGMVE